MVHVRQVARENQQTDQAVVPDGGDRTDLSDGGGPTTRHPGSPRPSTVRPSTTGSVGLLLAGRYRLEERRGRDGDSSTWDGHDEQLDRRVLVRVVSGTAVAPTLVAARAAVLHLDPALARILDTGSARATDGTLLAWVVEERPAGERLGDLVRERALDGEDARAVVAGAAAALARAAAVGHHHRRLGPASLYVDGRDVVVSGLLVAAAAAGLEDVGHERAEREDAVGLVCLLYAALSGLWPYSRLESLGAAPRMRGGAVPLRDLAPSTPVDLDALASQTLGALDDGPLSPADLVVRLVAPAAPDARRAAPGRDVAVASSRQVVLPATPVSTRVGPATPAPPRASPPLPAQASPQASPHAARSPRRAARAARGSAREGGPEASAAPPAPVAADAARELPAAAVPDPAGPDEAPRGPRRGAERAAAMTGSAREAFDRSRARARAAAVVAVSGREELRGGTGEQEALPLLQEPATAGRSGSHLNRVTAGVVAAVVAVLLVVAVAVAWRQLPNLSSLTSAVPSAGSRAAPSAAPPAAPPPAAPSALAPAPAPAPVVSGVRVLDQDEQGRSDQLPALLDDDPSTSWTSQAYATASFGNLKPGVGLSLDLAGSATVSAVDLSAAGSGGTVEVRTSPDGSMDGSTVVATAPLGSGGAPATITLDPPVEAAHVVLWVTQLPSTPSGFRIDLSGVALR